MLLCEGAMRLLIIASLVLLVVTIVILGVTVLHGDDGKVSWSYSEICRRFLPENCQEKCTPNESTMSEINCDAVRYEDDFDEFQLRFGHTTFLRSEGLTQSLKKLAQSFTELAKNESAARSSTARELLEGMFIVKIVCALKASIWKTATLTTVYDRIGRGGCSSVTGYFVESLDYLSSTADRNTDSWYQDVAAIKFVIGSIPIAAECSQFVNQDRVNQFVDELNKLKRAFAN